MRKLSSMLIAVCLCTAAYAINDVETVTSVSDNRTLTTPLDLVITADKDALTGTIDLRNDDAAVIFENIVPTVVIDKYLKNISIDGAAASNGDNCRVGIYRQGAIVLPRGKSYPALTVYTEADFGGDSKTYSQGNRQATLGKFDNAIRSFKLKRGYMATFANHTDGTGYSHCYIADREDLELNLPTTMAGRVSMLRVFVWNWVSKKGCSDARDENMMNTAHATWYYDWGAGRTSRINHEYSPQRHHEAGESNGQGWKGAWESWSNINASDETCTHVLGQNEPDNTSGAGEVYTYVTTIPDNPREKHAASTLAEHAKEFLYSGKRIGTFACCNPNTGWVSEYVNYCRQNNIRIDFVATHYYIGGQSPANCINSLKSLYNATGLPVWATEWNNGANWTGEGGFNTDSEGWYNWSDNLAENQRKNGVWLRDVLKRADAEPWLERLAVYNAVEDRRSIYVNGQITPAGEVWGSHLSGFAYDSRNKSINYFMPWTNSAPEGLTATYDNKKKTVALTWRNPNTDMTDYAVVEVKQGAKWVTVARIELTDKEELSATVDVSDYEPAFYTFRVSNNDYDDIVRRTAETASITIAASNTVGQLQFGRLKISGNDAVTTEIDAQETAPYVVVGLISYKNTSNGITNQILGLYKSSFKFRFYPWQLPTPIDVANAETADYIVLPADAVYHLSDDMMLISGNAGKVRGETQVTFPEPFPEGVTPVVVAQQNVTNTGYAPVTVKVYDVTNTGFKVKLVQQEKATGSLKQNVNYFAASPGQIAIGNGKLLTVGRSTTPLGGTTQKGIYFTNAEEEQLYLVEPYIVAAPQTNNYVKTSVIRQRSLYKDGDGRTYGASLIRQVDGTSTSDVVNSDKENGDYMGWIIVSDDPDGTGNERPIIVPTGIESITPADMSISVYNHAIHTAARNLRIYAASGAQVMPGTPLPDGLYIVTDGKRSTKVQVR